MPSTGSPVNVCVSSAESVDALAIPETARTGSRCSASQRVAACAPSASVAASTIEPTARRNSSDETSVAVAASFETGRGDRVQAVLQGASREDLCAAAESVALPAAVTVQRGDTNAVVEAVVAARTVKPSAAVVLTGGSELVLVVRSALRGHGLRDVMTKTYWIPGKTGLD